MISGNSCVLNSQFVYIPDFVVTGVLEVIPLAAVVVVTVVVVAVVVDQSRECKQTES